MTDKEKVRKIIDNAARKLYYGRGDTASSNLDYIPRWNEVPDVIKDGLRKQATDILSIEGIEIVSDEQDFPRILVDANHVEDVRRIKVAITEAGFKKTVKVVTK